MPNAKRLSARLSAWAPVEAVSRMYLRAAERPDLKCSKNELIA